MAPGIVGEKLEAVSQSLVGGELQAVIVAVCASGQLIHCAEPAVGWFPMRERREASLAYGLVSVYLHLVWQIDSARADKLDTRACRFSKLMFDTQAPLQKIGSSELTIRDCGERDRWQTLGRIGLRRSAG